MANNYWLSALNKPNTTQKLNPFAGASLPKTGKNAFTNFQFQQLVNNVAAKNTATKPADNIVAPSNTKTVGQQQQEVNQIKPASSAMNFDANKLQGLNSAYSRQQGGTANADDIKNLEYATARGFKPTTSSSALPTTPALSTAPTPIQTPATAPTSPTVTKTSDDAYKEAARAYIASLAPSSDVNSAKQKYADFISSANLGSESLQGQGRGIPLSLVRGQQEKLYNQSQIEAERLQGDVNLATGSQAAQQAQALAGMNLEKGLLDLSREDLASQNEFQNKLAEAGYTSYQDTVDTTGLSFKPGLAPQSIQELNKLVIKPLSQWTATDKANFKSATGKDVETPQTVSFKDPITGETKQYIAPAKEIKAEAPITKTIGKTLYQYNRETGEWEKALGDIAGASVGTGGGSSGISEVKLTAEQKKVQSAIDSEIKKLARGGSWADSFNYIKNLYPDIPNEIIDEALRKDQYDTGEVATAEEDKKWWAFWK